ncbi:hypothetical protein HPB49_026494 [Dermacentor silvarum]|nr:hypothetical protein HPB49_025726 [Dermacentor silvarum]KAH7985318.1 hypothetical protein HPB49_026494 [Dermacentor silvarum]
MGRKCFVPHCNTGYKSCQQKFSLFSAPKDEARQKLWRHAILRKDRILQPSDHAAREISNLVLPRKRGLPSTMATSSQVLHVFEQKTLEAHDMFSVEAGACLTDAVLRKA